MLGPWAEGKDGREEIFSCKGQEFIVKFSFFDKVDNTIHKFRTDQRKSAKGLELARRNFFFGN